MKKLIVIIVALVSLSSCGIFQRNSYMMRRIDRYDYKHNQYFYYNDNAKYNIGDTIAVDGFKSVVADARY